MHSAQDRSIFCLFSWKIYIYFLFLCVFHRRSKLMQVCHNMMRGKNDDRIFIFVWTIPLNVVRNFTGADKNRNLEGSGKKTRKFPTGINLWALP